MDVKVGEFDSPMSAEAIDATANLFYSHSYIFNFGVPFKHTGVLTTTHLSSVLDLYAGIDTGVNAWVGRAGDNGHWAHGQVGLGLNLMDGNLTVVGLSHIGQENPQNTPGVNANTALRYVNDVLVTWKVQDALTLTTDLNYIHDDGLKASGGGIAQYAAYTLNDTVTLVGRGEVWRDDKGAFVSSFLNPQDPANAARGLPTSPGSPISGGKTTYGALTIGLNIKPEVSKTFEGLVFRPELRYDQSLNGTKPSTIPGWRVSSPLAPTS